MSARRYRLSWIAAMALAVAAMMALGARPIGLKAQMATRIEGQAASDGSVLEADSLTDAATGILPESSANASVQMGYVDGEYQIAVTNPSSPPQFVPIPGRYDDTSTKVDARVVGDPTNQVVALYCRRQDSPVSGYRFDVYPGSGTADLVKNDDDTLVLLQETIESPAILTGNQTNDLELTCLGQSITASVNGTQVVDVHDDSFQSGYSALLGGAVTQRTSDARFENLVMSQPRLLPVGAPTAG